MGGPGVAIGGGARRDSPAPCDRAGSFTHTRGGGWSSRPSARASGGAPTRAGMVGWLAITQGAGWPPFFPFRTYPGAGGHDNECGFCHEMRTAKHAGIAWGVGVL